MFLRLQYLHPSRVNYEVMVHYWNMPFQRAIADMIRQEPFMGPVDVYRTIPGDPEEARVYMGTVDAGQFNYIDLDAWWDRVWSDEPFDETFT